jgi:GDP-L-fucose synthase
MSINKNMKIYVADHLSMVGSAILRDLRARGFSNIVTRSNTELDLTNQQAVEAFFQVEKPEQVYLAVTKARCIHANNTYSAEFIYQNLMMEANVIHQAFLAGVKMLLFLGSSCAYPKMASQPMAENTLLMGKLEATNESYAIAKIAGIKLCESYNRQYGQSHQIDYRSVMPANLYGPGDNYHPENSQVIPGLIRRFHEATKKKSPEVVVWGTGTPMREFLYVDDMAAASVFVMELDRKIYHQYTEPMQSHINMGFGSDLTIKELAEIIGDIVGYQGQINFDITRPDGTPKKLMSSERLKNMGWEPKISLEDGLRLAYEDFLREVSKL